MRRPLNLARTPFRNEGIPRMALGLAVVLALGLTAEHALAIYRLRPGRAALRQEQVERLETELRGLRSGARERTARPDAQTLAQWSLIKDLVDRRAFSWTRLFARLEEVLPPNVRLISVAPTLKGGAVHLEIVAVARSAEAGWGVVRALQKEKDFQEVYPQGVSPTPEGEEFRYSMRYLPLPEAASAPQSPGEDRKEMP